MKCSVGWLSRHGSVYDLKETVAKAETQTSSCFHQPKKQPSLLSFFFFLSCSQLSTRLAAQQASSSSTVKSRAGWLAVMVFSGTWQNSSQPGSSSLFSLSFVWVGTLDVMLKPRKMVFSHSSKTRLFKGEICGIVTTYFLVAVAYQLTKTSLFL